MLRPGVTQELVDEGELPSEQTKNQRWRRPYNVLAEATRGEVIVRVHHTRICMIGAARELDYFNAHIRLREPDRSEDKADWRRPCMRVAVCLSIDHGELLGGHSSVEAGGRKGRGSDDESSGAQLPKCKASVRKEVNSEEHHSAAEADLPIAKEGMQM
ncbi:hypothetical protein BHM03_00056394 [Ensete ventricosum]|nr:hypothetical protein BHM03_00056394 [Ensete ventricosum]